MKGQPIMKHAKDLIGRSVHVYRQEFKTRSDLPRAGIITGFGYDEGLFSVMVFHNIEDIRAGLMPIADLPGCLVVHDPDDLPVGVGQYALICGEVHNAKARARQTDEFLKESGGKSPETTKSPASDSDIDLDEEIAKEIETTLDEGQEDQGPDADAQDEDLGEGPGSTTEPMPNGDTAVKRLVNTPDFKTLIGSIEGLVPIETGANELVLQIEAEDKPIARFLYTPARAPATEITVEPMGFTIKLRDQSGRCTRILEANICDLDTMKKALKSLRVAVLSAMQAEPGDFGSTAANMSGAINEHKSSL